MNSHTPKIQLTDSIQDVFFKISEGNPGALNVCLEIYSQGDDIDPDNFMGGLGHLLNLDTLGIYGSKIWMLFKDVCKQDIVSTIALLRGWQLGFITEHQLHIAINNNGGGIDVADVRAKVAERLPRFAKSEQQIEVKTEA